MNATFSLWSRSIFVDFTHAELEGPGVYKIQLTAPVDHKRIFSSQIRLLDADQDKFSYTPRTNSLFANDQGLFTIQKKRSLLIAWPSSQMELPSKGEGVLNFPCSISPWIIGVAFSAERQLRLAVLLSPFPTWKVQALAQRSVALAAWSLRMLGRHPLIVLSLPSAYLLSVYPPYGKTWMRWASLSSRRT